MTSRRGIAVSLTSIAGLCLALLPATAALGAQQSNATLYVSPAGSNSNGDTACSDAGYSTVQSAVFAAPQGGTVVVCSGTYAESVTITQTLTLEGQSGAIIDATGSPFGYGIGIAADNVTVEGMTVENAPLNPQTGAPGDGIVTAGVTNLQPVTEVPGNDAVIVNNVVTNNGGAGIDLNSTTGSLASHNISTSNGIGVTVSDDLGVSASNNRISDNVASNNPGGCGIVLAEHSGAGIFGNVVSGNTANNNGLGTPTAPNASSGSGILIAGANVGGVYNNLIQSNRTSGNGHGGVNVHIHAPGAQWTGNVIQDNVIGTNNVRDDAHDKKTTGIYLGSAVALNITVRNNVITHNADGVFTAGPVKISGKGSNFFRKVTKKFIAVSKY